jgi:hypothetical protein
MCIAHVIKGVANVSSQVGNVSCTWKLLILDTIDEFFNY